MVSEKRSAAARANGARSRGPKTPQGKARSSQNATRHGLRSKFILLPDESREAFQTLLDRYIDRFRPAGDAEMRLVQQMAAAYWRLRRAMAIETDTMDAHTSGGRLDRLAAAFGDPAFSSEFQALLRYQTHFHRAHSRALRGLLNLRCTAVPRARNTPNEPKTTFPVTKSPVLEPADVLVCPCQFPRNAGLQACNAPNEPKPTFLSTKSPATQPGNEPTPPCGVARGHEEYADTTYALHGPAGPPGHSSFGLHTQTSFAHANSSSSRYRRRTACPVSSSSSAPWFVCQNKENNQ